MAFAPGLRKFTFTTHATSSVGWLGAVLAFLALALIGLTSKDEATVRGAYLVMAPAANTFSRLVERQADDYGLALTGNPGAFADALERFLEAQKVEHEQLKAEGVICPWVFNRSNRKVKGKRRSRRACPP